MRFPPDPGDDAFDGGAAGVAAGGGGGGGGGGGVGGGGNAWDWWWKESMRWSGDARPDASPCAAASMVSIRSEATDRCDGGSGVDAAKVASEAAASDSMTLLFDFGGGRPCNVGGAIYIIIFTRRL